MVLCYHFTLSAQYAADIFPLAMLDAWRALNALVRAEPSGEPLTPCCPNLIVFIWSPTLATTTCDFVGWLGVRFGWLYPDTPARFRRESFSAGMLQTISDVCTICGE